MYGRICAGWVTLLLAATACAQDRWQQSEFVVYLWGTPEIADAESRAAALASAGFTVVDWSAAELDVLQRHGLRAMIHGANAEVADQVKNHPAVWGYHCADEPYPEEQFAPLAERFRQLKQADPNHPAFVNMLSTTGQFVRTYLDVVQPEVLSFDYYQWWWGSHRYFEKLEFFRDAAKIAGVPLGSCVEATANPWVESGDQRYLPDNAAKLRQSVYTNLAYGVTMIEWFSARQVFQPQSGELTESGKDVAALNQELKILGPVLVQLKSIDVFHSHAAFAGTRTFAIEHWLQVSAEQGRGPIVVGMFVDDQEFDYALLVNSDYRSAQSVSVKLQSKWLGIAPWNKPKNVRYHVESFDRSSGQWQAVTSSSSTGFTTVIDPGDGQLYRLRTEIIAD